MYLSLSVWGDLDRQCYFQNGTFAPMFYNGILLLLLWQMGCNSFLLQSGLDKWIVLPIGHDRTQVSRSFAVFHTLFCSTTLTQPVEEIGLASWSIRIIGKRTTAWRLPTLTAGYVRQAPLFSFQSPCNCMCKARWEQERNTQKFAKCWEVTNHCPFKLVQMGVHFYSVIANEST